MTTTPHPSRAHLNNVPPTEPRQPDLSRATTNSSPPRNYSIRCTTQPSSPCFISGTAPYLQGHEEQDGGHGTLPAGVHTSVQHRHLSLVLHGPEAHPYLDAPRPVRFRLSQPHFAAATVHLGHVPGVCMWAWRRTTSHFRWRSAWCVGFQQTQHVDLSAATHSTQKMCGTSFRMRVRESRLYNHAKEQNSAFGTSKMASTCRYNLPFRASRMCHHTISTRNTEVLVGLGFIFPFGLIFGCG